MSHREEPQLNGSGLLFDLSVADISLNSMNTSLEIREIINDYNDTLKTATEEIKTLNRFDFFLKKISQSRPLFVYFRPFLVTISIILIEKIVVGVLGIRNRGHRIVGADKKPRSYGGRP